MLPAKLDVRYNYIDADGKAAIEEALHGKEGFELLFEPQGDSDSDSDDESSRTKVRAAALHCLALCTLTGRRCCLHSSTSAPMTWWSSL